MILTKPCFALSAVQLTIDLIVLEFGNDASDVCITHSSNKIQLRPPVAVWTAKLTEYHSTVKAGRIWTQPVQKDFSATYFLEETSSVAIIGRLSLHLYTKITTFQTIGS